MAGATIAARHPNERLAQFEFLGPASLGTIASACGVSPCSEDQLPFKDRTLAIILLSLLSALGVNAQNPAEFSVEVRAFDSQGEPAKKVRIALLPLGADDRRPASCVYPTCKSVVSGRYRLMAVAEGLTAIDREVVVSPSNRLLLVEMAPGIFYDHRISKIRSVIVTPRVESDARARYSVRLLGLLNGTSRSEPVEKEVIEFPEVESGRYLLLLLKDGKIAACSALWHDETRTSREVLEAGNSGCQISR